MLLSKIKIKAVIYGALVDTGCSLAIGFFYVIVMMILRLIKGEPIADDGSFYKSSAFLIFSLIAGFISTVFGGYIAGKVAKQSELIHGGIVGMIGIFIGLCFASGMPIWFNILSSIGMIPFGITGGFLSSRWHKRSS